VLALAAVAAFTLGLILPAEVTSALIIAVPPMAAVIVQTTRLRHDIGSRNGHGSLMEMSERLLISQAVQDGRLASLEEGQVSMARHQGRVADRLDGLATEVRFHHPEPGVE
jgi:hypothetical protein